VYVIFGCVAVALLALAVDQLLALMQAGVARRKHAYVGLASLGLLALVAASLAPGFARPQAAYVIGAKTFTEQYVLAALLQQRLAQAGLSSRVRSGLGSNVLFDALAAGDVDVAVDYSGTLWVNRMNRTDVPARQNVLEQLGHWLMQTHGIHLAGPLGFENAYALAMPRAKAQALNVHSLTDLARVARQLTIASDYEFFARPEWRALRETYGLQFRAERTMQPEFMYRAAAAGEVDVISAYTSDGQISQFDVTVLDDPKHIIPPYDAVLLVSARRANDEKLLAALRPLIGAISVNAMREANAKAASGTTTDQTANWLSSKITRR
jgi:osmoprotectant transport system permease protein